jgi:tetratricopeptide (TPR) repeat protein
MVFVVLTSCDEKKNAQREANQLYENRDFKKAENAYRKILTMDSTYCNAIFNLGNTHYNLNDTNKLDIAQNYWQKAYDLFDNKDSAEKMNAVYNQGNVKFKKATQYFNDSSAISDAAFSMIDFNALKEAGNMYKAVLRQFPNDTDARYNLSMVNYLLSRQPKNENQQNQQQKENQPQNQQNASSNQQNSPQHRQKKDMEDMNRMLEALKNNEKKTLRKLKKEEKKDAQQYRSEKDW